MTDETLVLLLKIVLTPPVFLVSFAVGYFGFFLLGMAISRILQHQKD